MPDENCIVEVSIDDLSNVLVDPRILLSLVEFLNREQLNRPEWGETITVQTSLMDYAFKINKFLEEIDNPELKYNVKEQPLQDLDFS